MKAKPRLDSKQSATVAALKHKLVRAKIYAEEMKTAARKVKVDFKQVRKAYKAAKKAAKQARKAVKALAQEIKARAPKKVRRPGRARPVGAKQAPKKAPVISPAAPTTIERVSLGVTDGPVEAVVPVAPNPSSPISA